MNTLIDLTHLKLTQSQTTGLSANDPFADTRMIAWQGKQDMAVGRVSWQGSLPHENFPHTELLIVHSGVLLIGSTTQTLRVVAGEAVLITQGASPRIKTESPVQWSFCSVSAAHITATSPDIQRIDFATPLKPSLPPAATVLLSSEPQCRSGGAYDDTSTGTRIGIWDSTPYTRKQVPHRLNEFMYLLEGSVTLTDETGTAWTFNKGDIVFVPKGTPCAWHSAVNVCKLYWVQE